MNEMVDNEKMPLEVKRFPIAVIKTKTGNCYWNVYQGKFSDKLEDVQEDGVEYQLLNKKLPRHYGLSYQYSPQNDMICIIACMLDLSCSKEKPKNVPREWKEVDRIYISRNREIYVRNVAKKNIYSWEVGKDFPTSAEIIPYCERVMKGWKTLEWGYTDEQKYFRHKCGTKLFYSYPNNQNIIIINAPHEIKSESGETMWYEWDVMKPFHDMFGEVVPIGGNKMMALDSLSAFISYAGYKIPADRTSENEQALLAVPLENPEVFMEKIREAPSVLKNNHYTASRGNVLSKVLVQRVSCKTPMCVIRFFFSSYYGKTIEEGSRMYVSDKKVLSFKKIEGRFQKNKMATVSSDYFMPIQDFDKSVLDGTMLKYFGEIVEEVPPMLQTMALWSFMKYPITEKMYKIPYLKDIVLATLAISYDTSPIKNLCKLFGCTYVSDNQWRKENNVYKTLGFNKYQLERLSSLIKRFFMCHVGTRYYDPQREVGKSFKILANAMLKSGSETGSVAALAEKNSQYLLDCCERIFTSWIKPYSTQEAIEDILSGKYPYPDFKSSFAEYMGRKKEGDFEACTVNYVRTMKVICASYSLETLKKAEPWIFSQAAKETLEIKNYSFGSIAIDSTHFCMDEYRDTIYMLHQLDMTTQIKPPFRSIEDLMDLHDNLSAIMEFKKEEISREAWKKHIPRWERLSYSNKSFAILLPKKPEELATEGRKLNHCVRSYIKRVLDGETNILFLRKTDDMDTPFYTIEVDNDNVIQQVHGFCNSYATEEVSCFVREWAKAKKLHMSNYNKVR